MSRYLTILAYALCLFINPMLAGDRKSDNKNTRKKGPHKIIGVDVKARKITVAVGKKEETIEVSKTAKITVRGAKNKKIEDVSLNLYATFTLDRNGKATAVVATRGKNVTK